MIDADTRGAWDALTEKLRSFVEKRVHTAADIDDIVQDVLVRIYTRSTDVGDERFGGWVYAVARNAIVDHYRKRAVPTPVVSVNESGAEDAPALLGCVAPFVARLPSPYREAVTLVEFEGMTQQAAADIAGVSLSGMKSRVQRGRRMLRDLFEECCALTVDVRGRVVDAQQRAACSCSPGGCRTSPSLVDLT